jgi:hypothetical protein
VSVASNSKMIVSGELGMPWHEDAVAPCNVLSRHKRMTGKQVWRWTELAQAVGGVVCCDPVTGDVVTGFEDVTLLTISSGGGICFYRCYTFSSYHKVA